MDAIPKKNTQMLVDHRTTRLPNLKNESTVGMPVWLSQSDLPERSLKDEH